MHRLLKHNKNIYQRLEFLKKDDKPKLHRNENYDYKNDDSTKEFNVGLIVIILVVLLLITFGYYLLVFQPQMQELQEHKNIKINQVNQLFNTTTSEDANKQAILAKIDSASTVSQVDDIDVYAWATPIIKNNLKEQIKSQKDKFGRVQINTENTSNIISQSDANKYLNTLDADGLSKTSISMPDTVIIPLSLNRRQAASGLLKTGDSVDIYNTNKEISTSHDHLNATGDTHEISDESNQTENKTSLENIPVNSTVDKKLVGGATVVSILRSKDSGSVDSNIELSQYPHTRNYTQSSKVDIEEVIRAKSSGTLDESKLKIILEDYGWKISNYERLANIGDLDCEYIIMLEVPRDATQDLINNMDTLLLVIPSYDAPDWVIL
ncbi:DUF515 domain-containing protein [Methanosphaera sp. BMS]|uniref:DUF515 domain-containing protein n=1 Tax=Methanosphaera sp. BMS TaxID=1789762 RepID=UPI0013A695D3|nr:DUF515 domain-containing protein [Methanosphaera sp. BMS]